MWAALFGAANVGVSAWSTSSQIGAQKDALNNAKKMQATAQKQRAEAVQTYATAALIGIAVATATYFIVR